MKTNQDTESKPDSEAAQGRLHPLVGPDSKVVYITCHAMSISYMAAMVGAFIWLAYELQNGWVLWAILISSKTYKHDFNNRKNES